MTSSTRLEMTIIPVPWDEEQVTSAVEAAIRDGQPGVRKSSMKLGPYNGFSGEMRVMADYKIKIAIHLGLIPKPHTCSICGACQGRIDYHAEDYSRPFCVAAICSRCHMKLHSRNRSAGYALSWQKLVAEFATGQAWFEDLR